MPKPKILITVSGGIAEVFSNTKDIEVCLVDFDSYPHAKVPKGFYDLPPVESDMGICWDIGDEIILRKDLEKFPEGAEGVVVDVDDEYVYVDFGDYEFEATSVPVPHDAIAFNPNSYF